MELTHGTLLGGRVRYAQPAVGYRTGLEPVLLAACVPARPGERVLEAGTGAGAGLLCLAARVPGICGVGLELDPAMATLAAENVAANGMGGLCVEMADVRHWRADAPFDHAFANPPWFDAAATPSPLPARQRAKQAQPGLLAEWVAALARALRPRGSLTLILPASALADGIVALREARCGDVTLLAFYPKLEKPAKIMILNGLRCSRGLGAIRPGMVLHDADGLTQAAQAVLRDGAGIKLA